MNSNPKGVLERLAAASLEKCLRRLSRAAATWQAAEIKVSAETLEDAVKRHDFKNPAAAVYFTLPGAGLTALMLSDPSDMECISKGFTGRSIPRGGSTTPAEELMLLELGNIVLNALLNSLLNALKKGAMPGVPQFIEGDAARVVGGLGAVADLKRVFCVIKAKLVIRCGSSAADCEVFATIPEELASELERSHSRDNETAETCKNKMQ
ncbi:MAG: hypothetical protein Q7R35_02310 [Elusimicrobiota bacterium]|nr:hypothetical protein [Elusimicrobiota bacterium]